MAKLKDRLNQLHIFDQDVCDCHEDNKLSEVSKVILYFYVFYYFNLKVVLMIKLFC